MKPSMATNSTQAFLVNEVKPREAHTKYSETFDTTPKLKPIANTPGWMDNYPNFETILPLMKSQMKADDPICNQHNSEPLLYSISKLLNKQASTVPKPPPQEIPTPVIPPPQEIPTVAPTSSSTELTPHELELLQLQKEDEELRAFQAQLMKEATEKAFAQQQKEREDALLSDQERLKQENQQQLKKLEKSQREQFIQTQKLRKEFNDKRAETQQKIIQAQENARKEKEEAAERVMQKRLAEEAEKAKRLAEEEKQRLAAEEEKQRLAAEEQKQRLLAESQQPAVIPTPSRSASPANKASHGPKKTLRGMLTSIFKQLPEIKENQQKQDQKINALISGEIPIGSSSSTSRPQTPFSPHQEPVPVSASLSRICSHRISTTRGYSISN
jgi:hypothetical protein